MELGPRKARGFHPIIEFFLLRRGPRKSRCPNSTGFLRTERIDSEMSYGSAPISLGH